MTLRAWIKELGAVKVSKKLNVDRTTVLYWQRGGGLPKAHTMKKIRDITHGLVSYEDMIDAHYR